MATRSIISIKNDDSTYTSVYCHTDGYPEGVGHTLKEFYKDEDRIRELFSYGNMSSLDELISESERALDETYLDNVTVFFGRDRGETDQEAVIVPNKKALKELATDMGCEYIYIFNRGGWSMIDLFE